MGYTHYWRTFRSFNETEWSIISKQAKRIIELAASLDIRLGDAMGENTPVINDKEIRLNGLSPESCESFVLTQKQKKPQEGEDATRGVFDFCKTRHLPYDSVVVSLLYLANQVAPCAIVPSSDGGDIFMPTVDHMAEKNKVKEPPQKAYGEVNQAVLEKRLTEVLDKLCHVMDVDFENFEISKTLSNTVATKFSNLTGSCLETAVYLSWKYDSLCDVAEALGANIKKEYKLFKHLKELLLTKNYANN